MKLAVGGHHDQAAESGGVGTNGICTSFENRSIVTFYMTSLRYFLENECTFQILFAMIRQFIFERFESILAKGE